MDQLLFQRFIENMLHLKVFSYKNTPNAFEAFEKEFCFEKSLQPMYTAEGLAYLVNNLSDHTFYEIQDNLGTCLLLFQFESDVYTVGPYVKNKYTSEEIQLLLVRQHLPASVLIPLKMYYDKFPNLSYYMVQGAVKATMETFVPNHHEYVYRSLTGFHEDLKRVNIVYEAEKTYAQIIQRYEMENFFLRKIKDGDVNGVRVAFENLVSNYYMNADPSIQIMYSTNNDGFAVLRTLARKAAENGGASIIRIDEITRKVTNQYNNARTVSEVETAQKEMLIQLTQAVADAKLSMKYSPVIRKVLADLLTNYSQDISLSHLAANYHISAEYLSRLFKKEIGQTISDYITELRIKKSAELLRKTTLPISEIALYVGYEDSNYFVKRFKKIYNMTPSEYRRG